jgi:serine O-acetyltransferase
LRRCALTGIEIHPGAEIGRGFFIDHGMGVVIGETTRIGDGATLYQDVALGGTGKEPGKRHPTHVYVGLGSKVLGAIELGDNVRIGAGSVVLHSVPANCAAVGVPARVVRSPSPETQTRERVESLPDPEGDTIRALQERLAALETRFSALERRASSPGVPGTGSL